VYIASLDYQYSIHISDYNNDLMSYWYVTFYVIAVPQHIEKARDTLNVRGHRPLRYVWDKSNA